MKINTSIHEIHEKQLGLLKELKRVCDLNNIKYYLACGTCLGAVRHKGFIPWDHDADVFIYAKDIQKLLMVKNQFKENIFLQGVETDTNFNYSIYRLRDSNTTYIEKCDEDLDINHGICIDIYPLYFVPDHKIQSAINIFYSYIFRICLADRTPINHGKVAKILVGMFLKITSSKRRKKIAGLCKKKLEKYKNTKFVATYFGLDITPVSILKYKTDWFCKPKKLLFEKNEFSCPSDCDSYLKKKYGDYMKLPPEKQREINYDELVFVDVNNSYRNYKGVYYCK